MRESREGTCDVAGCERPINARRLCKLHYGRLQRYGDASRIVAARDIPFDQRFWSRVDKSGGPNACWPWTGAVSANGYGGVTVARKPAMAHRVALELTLGRPIQTTMACHFCDNRVCCNPKHLYEGSGKENATDRTIRGRSNVALMSKTRIERGVAKGERNPRAKITMEQAREIRRRYSEGGISQTALGAEYGIFQTVVSAIIRGATWPDPVE